MKENTKCNGLARGPSRTTWPPAWLKTAPPAPTGPADLPPELRETWEERAAIMEFDGRLSREQAEAAALVDVLAATERAGGSAATV